MNEGNMGVMPVYDMARNNTGYNDGWFGGGIWALFILMFMCGGWGWNRGGWGNGNAIDAINGVTNEFLYTNLNGTIDRGFNQIANQQFNTQKDIWQTQSALQMQLAQNGFEAQNCCCQTQRAIDSVKYEAAQNTCAITTNATNNTQKILDKLCSMELNMELNAKNREINAKEAENANLRMALAQANGQLSQQAQSANLIAQLRPTPQPSYIVNSPYQSIYPPNNGNGYNACGCFN